MVRNAKADVLIFSEVTSAASSYVNWTDASQLHPTCSQKIWPVDANARPNRLINNPRDLPWLLLVQLRRHLQRHPHALAWVRFFIQVVWRFGSGRPLPRASLPREASTSGAPAQIRLQMREMATGRWRFLERRSVMNTSL